MKVGDSAMLHVKISYSVKECLAYYLEERHLIDFDEYCRMSYKEQRELLDEYHAWAKYVQLGVEVEQAKAQCKN